MDSPAATHQDLPSEVVSMALLVAVAKKEKQEAQEEYTERIDRAVKKLAALREKLVHLDEIVRKMLHMANILQFIDNLAPSLEEITQQIAEHTLSVEELSHQMNISNNNNLFYGSGVDVELEGNVQEVFAEKSEKDLKNLSEAVKIFAQNTNKCVEDYNKMIQGMLEYAPMD